MIRTFFFRLQDGNPQSEGNYKLIERALTDRQGLQADPFLKSSDWDRGLVMTL